MSPQDRAARIPQILRQRGYLAVDDLSQELTVSQMTICHDLKDLEQAGLINRYYGGASLKPERGDSEWPVLLRETVVPEGQARNRQRWQPPWCTVAKWSRSSRRWVPTLTGLRPPQPSLRTMRRI